MLQWCNYYSYTTRQMFLWRGFICVWQREGLCVCQCVTLFRCICTRCALYNVSPHYSTCIKSNEHRKSFDCVTVLQKFWNVTSLYVGIDGLAEGKKLILSHRYIRWETGIWWVVGWYTKSVKRKPGKLMCRIFRGMWMAY